jgi:hypothetical protein
MDKKTKVILLIKDNDSQGNQDLISFLKPNIKLLNYKSVTFEFRFITSDQIPGLISKGIDKLPAAYINDIAYMDSINIIAQLRRYLAPSGEQSSMAGGRPVSIDKMVGNPEEIMEEYRRREMNEDAIKRDAEDTSEEAAGKGFKERADMEMRRRTEEFEKSKPNAAGKSKSMITQPSDFVSGRPQSMIQPPIKQQRPSNVAHISGTDIPKSSGNADEDMLNRLFEETS